jgi:hypothetical protein
MPRKRNRLTWLVTGAVVVVAGYSSRKFAAHLPTFLADYTGDTLWALMVYIGTGFLFPEMRPIRVAAIALAFSFLIELSQLYQAPWINAVRQTTLGGLVLGYGFLWSDLVCYACGVMIGLLSETLCRIVSSDSKGAINGRGEN